jgi:hypothetical protein
VARPVYPLGGSTTRYYPLVCTLVGHAATTWPFDGHVDTAADDTIFPLSVAQHLGIDLSSAPGGDGRTVGGVSIPYRYAHVTLRISDGSEVCEWPAIVGFLDAPMRWALRDRRGSSSSSMRPSAARTAS